MKIKVETLNEMTKDQLAAFAKENGVTVKGVRDMRKADLVAVIAENVNRTVRGRKNRIKAAALALIQARGVNEITLPEFIDTVLAVCPEWDKANDEAVAKKHLSWYKSFYRKNILGQLARPRKVKEIQTDAFSSTVSSVAGLTDGQNDEITDTPIEEDEYAVAT